MKKYTLLLTFIGIIFLYGCIEDKDVVPYENEPAINQEFPIIEEVEPNGYIGTVSLPDTMSIETVKFSMESGDVNEVFHIDENTGDLYIKELMQSKDATTDFNLTVAVTEKSTEDIVLKIKLKITLSPSLFIYNTLKQIGYVNEDCEQGYLVGTVASIDTTFKLDFRFDIYIGNHLGIFKLDRQSGQLTVEQPSLIDYDTDSLHILNMVVSDHDNPKDSVLYYVNFYVHVKQTNTLQKGLIGYYPFNEDILDYSPLKNHALSVDQIQFIQGVNNKSIEFDGVSDYLELTETLSPNEAKAFSFWFHTYGPVEGQNNGSIISKYDKNLGRSLMINTFGPMNQNFSFNRVGAFYHAGSIYLDGDWVKSNYQDYEGEIPYGTEHLWTDHNAGTVDTTSWHHCVINHREDKLTIYIDNTPTVSKVVSYDIYNENSHVPTYIGNTFNGGEGNNNHFHGSLDELRIYNRPLTQEEIKILYQSNQ